MIAGMTMNFRLQWLDPLLTHLKKDETITDVGSFVFPMSQYRQINTQNQYAPSVWVIPQDGSVVSTKPVQGDPCKARVQTNILICTVVKNVIESYDHVGHEIRPDTTTDIYGAYIEASKLEEKVRASIVNFNKDIIANRMNFNFEPLRLTGMPEPDENNGHFILGQVYQTTFSF